MNVLVYTAEMEKLKREASVVYSDMVSAYGNNSFELAYKYAEALAQVFRRMELMTQDCDEERE